MDTYKKGLAEELEGLLLRINRGKDPQLLCKEAHRLITSITAHDIARVEERLVRSGISAQRVQQLSVAFILMGLMHGQNPNLRQRLGEKHLLRKVIAEHEMMLCFCADLEDVTIDLCRQDRISTTSSEWMLLTHIIEHLDAAIEHLERENDVIFPEIKRRGWQNLCASAESDHVHIRLLIEELVTLVGSHTDTPDPNFQGRLMSIVKTLCPLLKQHIFHEDHVLYPVAVAMIDQADFWDRLKVLCDQIGYCGVHL